MSPTLRNEDAVLCQDVLFGRGIERGQIVSLIPPQHSPEEPVVTKYVCKRVVAVAGDLVYSTKGVLYVNKEVYNEGAHGKTPDIQPLVIPRGHVYVLGDNREHSFDSSFYGPVKARKVKHVFCRKLKAKEVKRNRKGDRYRPKDFKSVYNACLKEIEKKWGID